MRPLIGITLDWLEKGSFSPRPHYVLRQSYFDAVWQAGGLPVAIPLFGPSFDDYLHRVDGMIVPGGDHETPAEWYVTPPHNHPKHPRAEQDKSFLQAALAADLPILGICAGMQTLAVTCGGKLYFRLKDEVEHAQDHRCVDPTQRHHDITVGEGSLLESLVKTTTFAVNSHHREAVAVVGPCTNVVAKSADGIIEAIEIKDKKFALGVQWHPEFFLTEGCPDRLIFEGFIEAARQHAAKKALQQ